MTHRSTPQALRLLTEGQLALAHIEEAGIRVDYSYLNDAIVKVTGRIKEAEARLKADRDVYPAWKRRFGERFNFGSRDQLAKVLFGTKNRDGDRVGGMYAAKGETATGRASTSKGDLADLDNPFVKEYLRTEELKKALSTYLVGLRRECVERDGAWFVHSIYNLNTVTTFRSSAQLINFQNQPARAPEIADTIRRCFIPRPGNVFGEPDYSQAEVRVSADYNHDPVLIDYILDKSKCMHRDTGAELFLFDKGFLAREAKWAKKCVRDWAKNRWVFPQFYGAVYFNCAIDLWNAMLKSDAVVPGTDLTIREHLAKKGIKELDVVLVKNPRTGRMELDHEPRPGSFGHHCKKVEESFWLERFKAYTQWKQRWWEQYLRDGGFTMLTGFACNGVFKRNDVLNHPVQGSSFHCLLWSLIQLVKLLRKYRMKTRIVGEIHDSLQFDGPPEEASVFLEMCHEVMVDGVRKHWGSWMVVPMEIEAEVSPVGESWLAKKEWIRSPGGVWGAKT